MNFTMSFSQLMPLAPVLIVVLTAVVVMILISIKRNHNLIATTSVVGLNLTAAYILLTMFGGQFVPSNIMGMFMVDPFTLLYQLLIVVASLACCTLSHAYIESYKDNREELYLLLLISVSGAMLMVASAHYASFFISLELMSIPMYGLLAYTYQRSRSLEAGIKYLVLSATASAMLLMGMAYIYAYTGSLAFYDSVQALFEAIKQPMVILGLGLIILLLHSSCHLHLFTNGHQMSTQVHQHHW